MENPDYVDDIEHSTQPSQNLLGQIESRQRYDGSRVDRDEPVYTVEDAIEKMGRLF